MKNSNRSAAYFVMAALLGAAGASSAANWPQFRGLDASGVDGSAPTPVNWNVEKGENVRWHTEIPGLAHSSPIIWGDRIYLTTAVGDPKQDIKIGLYGDIASANDEDSHQWRLIAIDKNSGKIIWDKLATEGIPRGKRHTKATHCNSTPATDGNRVVAIFGSEGLFCLDHDGKVIWHDDLGRMKSGYYVVPSAEWGFSSSPIIHDGKVIVLCDVLGDSFIASFSLADGHEVWRTKRKDVPTWSTPAIAKVGDRTEILVNGWHHTGSYDFANGQEIWKIDGGGDIPVPTPIVSDGMVYFTSAHGGQRPMRAVKLDDHLVSVSAQGVTNPAVAWQQDRKGDYLLTPILVGSCIYDCQDGIVNCFDAKTGDVKYSERLGDGTEGFTASPVSDGKNIYFTSETGKVYVVPATGAFSVAASNKLNDTCLASAAVSDGTIFFRTRRELLAIGKP